MWLKGSFPRTDRFRVKIWMCIFHCRVDAYCCVFTIQMSTALCSKKAPCVNESLRPIHTSCVRQTIALPQNVFLTKLVCLPALFLWCLPRQTRSWMECLEIWVNSKNTYLKNQQLALPKLTNEVMGSCCGTIASNIRGLRFESSHQQIKKNIYLPLIVR